MKIAIWCMFGLLAVLWTAAAWMAAELMQWAARFAASGAAADLSQAAGRWPLPAWLGIWVDPAWLQGLQDMRLWSVHVLRDGLPFIGSALGWAVPLVWLGWGVGTVALLAFALLAHWLHGRFLSPRFRANLVRPQRVNAADPGSRA